MLSSPSLGGNQRETDRQRAQARAAKHAKPKTSAGDLLKKKERSEINNKMQFLPTEHMSNARNIAHVLGCLSFLSFRSLLVMLMSCARSKRQPMQRRRLRPPL